MEIRIEHHLDKKIREIEIDIENDNFRTRDTEDFFLRLLNKVYTEYHFKNLGPDKTNTAAIDLIDEKNKQLGIQITARKSGENKKIEDTLEKALKYWKNKGVKTIWILFISETDKIKDINTIKEYCQKDGISIYIKTIKRVIADVNEKSKSERIEIDEFLRQEVSHEYSGLSKLSNFKLISAGERFVSDSFFNFSETIYYTKKEFATINYLANNFANGKLKEYCILGNPCSGKTTFAYSIIQKIRNRKIFYLNLSNPSITENQVIEDLNSFYSKKLKEIQDAIEEAIKEIDAERKTIEINFPVKKDIAEPFVSEYESAINAYETQKGVYKEKLSILETDLKSKGSSIFTSIKSTEIELVSLQSHLESIITVIKKHNKWLGEFGERKSAAIKKILKHYVAEYLKAEDYNKKEFNKDCAIQTIEKIEAKINANIPLIKSFNEQLSSTAKGQGELNDILEILLHRDDIKIEIREEKFRLERSGHPAEHLSEGEKSAIAFAYFLTELKALRKDDPPKLPKTIIFIDDPISSLDSNHIFQVRSLLKDFFKIDDFAQLFISTHNFEFFSVLYDSGIFGGIKSNTNENKRPLYFIKRDKNGVSTIEKMPKTFSNYKSEYVGLFHILKEFNDSADKENFAYLLLLPNALRRFVELYTLSKYPANNDSTVDQRVELIFKSNEKPHHNIKLLNWFSHQNQIEKLQQHDEKIMQISDAINDLIEYLKNEDELHWKGLNGIV